MSENSIEVRNLCISYKTLGDYSIRNVLKGKEVKNLYFQAVKNISFNVKKGEILGVIGKNGSGKSTMLRAIAGIFAADSGEVDIKGNSISLTAIGVGFKPDLSGRENVILSSMLLGFSYEEIMEKMDDVIEFSELGDFIDRPVRTYSSGMYSKLAFSITANLKTDIMLIDEVLSVGDERFSKKSFNRMKELISDKDRTVVIVSHNLPMLEELCDNVLWMHEGELMKYGAAKEVLQEYQQNM